MRYTQHCFVTAARLMDLTPCQRAPLHVNARPSHISAHRRTSAYIETATRLLPATAKQVTPFMRAFGIVCYIYTCMHISMYLCIYVCIDVGIYVHICIHSYELLGGSLFADAGAAPRPAARRLVGPAERRAPLCAGGKGLDLRTDLRAEDRRRAWFFCFRCRRSQIEDGRFFHFRLRRSKLIDYSIFEPAF